MSSLSKRVRTARLAAQGRIKAAYGQALRATSFLHMVALVEAGLPIWYHPLAERLRKRRAEHRSRRQFKARCQDNFKKRGSALKLISKEKRKQRRKLKKKKQQMPPSDALTAPGPSPNPSRSPSPSSSPLFSVDSVSEDLLSLSSPTPPDTGAAQSPFFRRFPAEVRRQVLIEAFGELFVHADARMRYPYDRRIPRSETLGLKLDPRTLSYLCDNRPFDYAPWDSRRPWCNSRYVDKWIGADSPHLDNILEDLEVYKWVGVPENPHIGVMGWLLSCKQAYEEGVAVLYSANSLILRSADLYNSIQLAFLPSVVAMITNLCFIWDPAVIRRDLGLVVPDSHQEGSLVLPNLRTLRIIVRPICKYLTEKHSQFYGHLLGLTQDPRTLGSGMRTVHGQLLPQLDTFLDRAVPQTTDVAVVLTEVKWFKDTQDHLIAAQGKALTRVEHLERAGKLYRSRMWRERPQEALAATTPRHSGFWFLLDEIWMDQHYKGDRRYYDDSKYEGMMEQWELRHRSRVTVDNMDVVHDDGDTYIDVGGVNVLCYNCNTDPFGQILAE